LRVFLERWHACQTLDGAHRRLEGLNVQSTFWFAWFAKTF
jgi:hypothetical protein